MNAMQRRWPRGISLTRRGWRIACATGDPTRPMYQKRFPSSTPLVHVQEALHRARAARPSVSRGVAAASAELDLAMYSAVTDVMKHLREAIRAAVQQEEGAFERAHRPHQLRGWLTVKEVAERLRFVVTAQQPERACRAWIRREQAAGRLTTIRRGRVILVDSFDLERRETPVRRRG